MPRDRLNDVSTMLVGVTLGLESIGAVELGKQMARSLGASLHVATVIQPMSAQQEAAVPGLAERHMENAREELDRFAASHGLEGAELHVVKGNPEEELFKLGRRLEAELLVVGRYGRSGLKRGVLGSVANRLVRKYPGDVLLAEPEFRGRLEVLGVASDLTPESEVALGRALGLGSALGAREVIFLHAYQLPVGYHTVMTEAEAMRRLEEVSKEESEAIIERVRAQFPDAPPVRCEFAEGSVAARVPELVREHGVQMLVLSTHDRTATATLFMGRLTEKIINRVDCSVWAEKEPGWAQSLKDAVSTLIS